MSRQNWAQTWQEEQDYHDWKSCLQRAIDRRDYPRVVELVKEGLMADYQFPMISDVKTLEIIATVSNR